MFGLSQIQIIIIAAGLAVVVAGGAYLYVYNKGERSGESTVKAAVATETVKTIDAARISKEKTDVEVHSTPYSERVDGLR